MDELPAVGERWVQCVTGRVYTIMAVDNTNEQGSPTVVIGCYSDNGRTVKSTIFIEVLERHFEQVIGDI